ncbi:lissencephaly-1-like protein [Hibiscus syriacus]|uniref:ribonuclease Z n=1 Tax=Hibiscus syriacus TaxID=106335 RepID=A0A6A2YDW4_HIBSY|nr:lissencephaly-1-like protein [Hibiscus syriacus]
MEEEGYSVKIWGPLDLNFLVGAMKSFIPHATMVHTQSFGRAPVSAAAEIVTAPKKAADPIVLVNDEVVKISEILLQPHCSQQSQIKPGEMSVLYICELPELMGKFDPKKAVALGLKPGPNSGLQHGKSVKSDHLDIMRNKSWLGTKRKRNLEVPILKSSARVASRLNYLCPQFFPSPGFLSLQHLNYSESDINSSEGSTLKICESIPAENLLKFTLCPYAQLGLDRSQIPIPIGHSQVIDELHSEIPEIADAAQNVRGFWQGLKESKEILTTNDNKVMIEEPWLTENTLPSCLENVRRDDLEIVLLGTGSSQPSKYRNVSSVYINLFFKGSLLLDCGEGTLGKLKRRKQIRVDGADNVIRNLKCAWISHIHADHHTGLARVLALRRDLLKGMPHERLLVIGPRQLKRYLDAYQRLEDLDMRFLDCRSTTEASWDTFASDDESNNNGSSPESPMHSNAKKGTLFARGSRMQSCLRQPDSPVDHSAAYPFLRRLNNILREAGLEALISFPVVHCPQSFGIVFKAAELVNSVGKVIPGWKIGTRVTLGPVKNWLMHVVGQQFSYTRQVNCYATFEDGLVDEAIARIHSTTKEAIEVGNSAGAYRIILTHFSQRYPKIPVFDQTHMHKTCIAFDMMSINITDLPVLPRVLPYLKLLFRNEMAVDESHDIIEALV